MQKIMVVFFLCIVALSCRAQEHFVESKSLAGFWQRVEPPREGTFRMDSTFTYPLPEFKIYHPDGTYLVFSVNRCDIPVLSDSSFRISTYVHGISPTIVHYGMYEVTSDSTCLEKVSGSLQGMHRAWPTIEVRYRMVTPDYMVVDCKSTKGTRVLHEHWKRVKVISEPAFSTAPL